MARTDFPAGLVTVLAALNGGDIYWFFRITPSGTPGPTNKYIVSGTIRTTSFTDTTVLADRLLDISDLDIRGNPLDSPLAKVADVKIKIQNITAGVDFDDYLGRIVEVFIGSGTTMSTATAAVMFTGKIKNVTTIKDTVTFGARGRGEIRDKEVGEKTGEDVHEKFRGRIFPISYGNWTADNAWLPVIPNRPIKEHPELIFDNQNWVDFNTLWIYDGETRVGYRAKLQAGNFILNAGNFEISFLLDTLTTVLDPIGGIAGFDSITLNDTTKITYQKFFASGTVAEPTILKIDDEYMYVWEDPATTGSSRVRVERGFLGTTIATHNAGTTVFQLNGDISKFVILMQHTFFADQVSGSHIITSSPSSWTSVQPIKDSDTGILNIQANAGSVDYEVETVTHAGTGAGNQVHAVTFVFPEVGITGTVIKQYWLTKTQIKITSANSDDIEFLIGLLQGGDFGSNFDTFNSAQGSAVSIQESIHGDLFTGIFDNVTFDGATGTHTGGVSTTLTDSAADFVNDGVLAGMRIRNKTSGILGHLSAVTATTCTTNFTWNPSDAYEICTETMIELTSTGSYVLDEIGSLGSKRYDAAFKALKIGSVNPDGGLGKYEYEISRFGFRIEFNASPFENDFWVKGQARKHPGSYFNGTINTLMEAPSIVLEDFLRRDVKDISATDLEEAFFDSFHTDRTAWKMAAVIYAR